MSATLIVIVFPTEDRAQDVFRALNAMRRRDAYNLDEALLAARSHSGMLTMVVPGDKSSVHDKNPIEPIARLILNQTHTEQSQVSGVEGNGGVDPHFAAAVASAMSNEFSALFFLVRTQSADIGTELSNVLALFRGQIARTTLTP